MKRIVAFTFVISFCFLLVACDTPWSTTGETTTETVSTTVPQTTTAPVLSFNSEEISLTAKGKTQELYDGTVPLDDITWGSENERVAIFENGVVTAVGNGDTVVYAEYGNKRITCAVHCKFPTTTARTPSTTPKAPTSFKNITEATVAIGGNSRNPVLAAPTDYTVDASFFDDAVFVGDSVSLKLSYYAAGSGELGKAKFLVVGSYGVGNAIYDHPDTKLRYQGVTYTNVEEAIAATGSNKLFIMLGMNDIGRFGVSKSITNWGTLLNLIRSTCPNITIYIQSMTPVWTGGEKGGVTNSRANMYNAELKTFAANNGCKFIDIAPYMKDSTGGLATPFCSDSFVHLTNEAAKTWVQVLKAYDNY